MLILLILILLLLLLWPLIWVFSKVIIRLIPFWLLVMIIRRWMMCLWLWLLLFVIVFCTKFKLVLLVSLSLLLSEIWSISKIIKNIILISVIFVCRWCCRMCGSILLWIDLRLLLTIKIFKKIIVIDLRLFHILKPIFLFWSIWFWLILIIIFKSKLILIILFLTIWRLWGIELI